MNNEEIARKLEEFQEYLSISNVFTDIMRWLAWVMVKGLAWIVDALENLTDDILLIKTFYNNPEIVAFVDTIKPVLYIFLAFSLLYTGYLLIFNKKFNREGIVINIFIACIIILALNAGMDKANEFTDVAIDAVKVETLYPNDDSTLSGSIIQRNITDLTEIDKSNWSAIELTVPNSTPPSRIANINVREKYGKDTEGISNEGQDISKYMLSLNNVGEYRADKFDQSGLEWNNEYYFRYSVNWFTIFVTLGIIGFTLFSIALKLAKLFFELTFNYILALIVAPADIHDGQKTKKIIQAILNTFFATILIFLSMKVYMIGTAYLEDTLSTFPYLIALIAFSLAVVDGPNIVERLFGIDAGLKNGWGVLAGAYAGGRMVSGLGKGLANMGKGDSDKKNKSMAAMSGGAKGEKAPSPNDAENDEADKNKKKDGTGVGVANARDGLNEKKSPSPNDEEKDLDNENHKNGSGAIPSISQQAVESSSGQRKQTKAPSPNDGDRATHSLDDTGNLSTSNDSHGAEGAQGVQQPNRQTDSDIASVADQTQGNSSISNVNSRGTSSPTNVQSDINNVPTSNGSHSVERAQGIQQSTVQTSSDITSTTDQTQGNSSGAPSPSTTGQTNVSANTGNAPNTSGASIVQKAQGVQQSNVQTENIVVSTQNESVHQSKRVSEKKGNAPSVKLRPSTYSIPNKYGTNQNRNI